MRTQEALRNWGNMRMNNNTKGPIEMTFFGFSWGFPL